MRDEAIERVGDRRAGRTPRRIFGSEHEMIDEKLRPASKEILQCRATLIGLEPIFLFDSHPRQLLTPPREVVAASRMLLLRSQQLDACCEPLFSCAGLVCCHRPFLLVRGVVCLVVSFSIRRAGW